MIDLDLHLLNLCVNVCSQMSLSAVVLKSPLRITSQIFKRMVGLVEMNSHRETPAVVSDALFVIIQSKS